MLALLLLFSPAWATDWLAARPLTLSPSVLRAEAEAHATTPGLHVLLDDVQVSVADDGKVTTRVHVVIALRGEEEVDGWRSLRFPWDGEEERPEIAIRVIQADGEEYRGDGSTFTEDGGSSDVSAGIFSDDRSLIGPTPGVEDGAIVEWAVVYRSSAAPLGGRDDGLLDLETQARRGRRELAAPSRVQVQHAIRGAALPETPVRKRGMNVWTVRWDDPTAAPDPVDGKAPLWAWSTWGSWAEVAAAWDGVTQGLMRDPALDPLLAEIPAGLNAAETARVAVRVLDARVRYSGLELGEHGLIPYTPAQIVQRGYGDCKDQAVMITALLRARGHDAHVALLSASTRPWPELMLPGFNRFNHAIVHVGGPAPLWVDPTARAAPAGALPEGDQQRPALLVDPASQGLVTTPSQARSKVMEVTGDYRGLEAAWTWKITRTGAYAIRSRYDFLDRDPVEALRARELKDGTGEIAAASFEVEGVSREEEALRETIRIRYLGHGSLRPGFVQSGLFAENVLGPLKTAAEEAAQGEHALLPGVLELRQLTRVPSGFTRAAHPERTAAVVGGVLSWSARQVDAGTWEDTLRFVPGEARPSREEVSRLKAVVAQWEADFQELRFEAPWHDALEAGKPLEARKAAEAAFAAWPDDGALRVHWAWTLHRLGLNAPAEQLLRAWLTKHPDDAEAWSALAWAETGRPDGRTGEEERFAEVAEAATRAWPWSAAAVDLLFPLPRAPESPELIPKLDPLLRRAAEENGGWSTWSQLQLQSGQAERVLELPIAALDTFEEKLARLRATVAARGAEEGRAELRKLVAEVSRDDLFGLVGMLVADGEYPLTLEVLSMVSDRQLAEALTRAVHAVDTIEHGPQKRAFEQLVAVLEIGSKGEEEELRKALEPLARGADVDGFLTGARVKWSPTSLSVAQLVRLKLYGAQPAYTSDKLVILRGADKRSGEQGLFLPLVQGAGGWELGILPGSGTAECGLAWDLLEAGDAAGALAMLGPIRFSAPRPVDPSSVSDVGDRHSLYRTVPWARDHFALAPAPLEGEVLRWEVMLEAAEAGSRSAMRATEALLPTLEGDRRIAATDALALGHRGWEEFAAAADVLAGRTDLRARLVRADMLIAAGRLAEARAEVEGLPRDPSDTALLARRGMLLAELGEYVAAARELRDASRAQDVTMEILRLATFTALRAGDAEGALDLASRLPQKNMSEVDVLLVILARQGTGRWEDAARLAMSWGRPRGLEEWALVSYRFAEGFGYADAAKQIAREAERPERKGSLLELLPGGR